MLRSRELLNTSTRLPGQVANDNGHLNGNGHGHHDHLGFGGNGHAKVGESTEQPAKKTRRVKPHMKNGRNQAAWRAYGAVRLMQSGLTIDQAIACTGSHTNYIVAMKWIVANDDQNLLDDVLHGRVDIFDAARQVRPLVEIRALYKKLTPAQRITWAVEENPDRVFEEVIVQASAMTKTMVMEPTTADVT